ncbi:MAG: hypothetical protein V5A38_13685 [Halolamina sp.]|uniref:hypothetical protein n=1 Tax=Halolamina sp. TaxID=1940283 RepID=UPI002FC329FB
MLACAPDVDRFEEALAQDADSVEPLSGVGTSRGWQFRLRFDDCAAPSVHRDRYRERDVAFTLHDFSSREERVESQIEPSLAGEPGPYEPITDD